MNTIQVYIVCIWVQQYVLVIQCDVREPQIAGLRDNKFHVIILRGIPSKSVIIPILVT